MAYPTRMEAMEQMMARAKEDRAAVRGRSAEAPGQRKKALGLRSARSLAPGRVRAAAAATGPRRALPVSPGSALRKRKLAPDLRLRSPRGTQS